MCSGVPLVCCPYSCSSPFLRCQPSVWRSFHLPQPWRRSSTPRSTPLRHQPSCADQSPPSPVEEGLDLHLPYQKHNWKVASVNTVCAWRLPSKTALHPRTFLRLKRSEERRKKKYLTSKASRASFSATSSAFTCSSWCSILWTTRPSMSSMPEAISYFITHDKVAVVVADISTFDIASEASVGKPRGTCSSPGHPCVVCLMRWAFHCETRGVHMFHPNKLWEIRDDLPSLFFVPRVRNDGYYFIFGIRSPRLGASWF